MPETVYRESRSYVRDRDDPDSDDGRYRPAPTVRRYKVTQTQRVPPPPPPPPPPVEHVERIERTERIVENDFIDDDRRSRFSAHSHHLHPGRSSGDLIEVDTTRRIDRTYLPERPRSAFDPPTQRSSHVIEKVVERERERSPAPDFYDISKRSVMHDDGRSAIYERTREFERENPWSADRQRTTVETKRTVERDDDRWYDDRDRQRTVVEKKVVEREGDRWWDEREALPRDRELVYQKTKEIERDRGPTSPRDWDRHSHSPWERENVDVRVERRIEKRDDGVDVTMQRRVEERRDEAPYGDIERYRKETEYYEPAPPDPAPIIIRQRAPEQRIIVQEAPEPAPIIVPYRQTQNTVVARREEPREDEYYYRRRELDRYGDRRDDYPIAEHRRARSRDRHSDGYRSDDEDVYIRRTIIRRQRSKSPEHHHNLHLAEGAVAGAGIAALAASRRSGDSDVQSGRGRKVLAGAALGALGTEVFKRARSVYNDRYGDDDDRYRSEYRRGRSRSRSRGAGYRDDYDEDHDRHHKIKTGLGLAAAALAVAGAAKYYQSQKIEKEELHRGRSLHRNESDSGDSYLSRSRSRGGRGRSRSRGSGIAKAAAGTAAAAGLVQHFRSKSRVRKEGRSKSRSQSRLRTGAEIVAAGLAGAAGKKMYDRSKDKKEERERDLSDEEYERELRERERSRSGRDRSRSRSRSISRSRSRSRHPIPTSAAAADPELGLVEYGGHPLYSDRSRPDDEGFRPQAAEPGYESAEDRRRRRRERLARQRSQSRGVDSDVDDSYDEKDGRKEKRARSRSRFREMAAGAAAAGAAAIGLKKFDDAKKDKKKAESRSRERSRERSIDREEREHDREARLRDRALRESARRDRERERRLYEDSIANGSQDGYDPQRPPSPPHASGGYFDPRPRGPAAAGTDTYHQGFTQHPNLASTNLHDSYTPYNPQEYPPVPHPPPGPPPNSASTPTGMPPPPTGGYRRNDPDYVSSETSDSSVKAGVNVTDAVHGHKRERGRPNIRREAEDGIKQSSKSSLPHERAPSAAFSAVSGSEQDTSSRSPSPPRTPSHVQWVPLSPQSSQTLLRHRAMKSRENVQDDGAGAADDAEGVTVPPRRRRFRKRRRNSDPSANRPIVSRRRSELPESDRSSSASDGEVEVLPDRFDSSGRPIDPNGPSSYRSARVRGGWTERRGDFEYRSPGPGGSQARGLWAIGGTDPDQVEKLVQDVTGIIGDGPPKGVGGWLGLAGRLLGSGILGAHGLPGLKDDKNDNEQNDEHDNNHGGRRGGGAKSRDVGKVGYGGSGSEVSRDERGKGRRRADDYEYNELDDPGEDEGMRRRRRRKRREVE